MSLRDRLLKNSKIKHASLMSDQEEEENFPTNIPLINLALSGDIDGGLTKGFTVIGGKSKHFKTLFGLTLVKAWFDKNSDDPEAVCVFYDSERGASLEYFEMQGIDTSKVIRKFVSSVEDMRIDISNLLDDIEPTDNVIIFWDSVSNVPSKKEVEDALDSKTTADMSRNKVLKSLSRILTIPLIVKNVPMIGISHTYETMELYSKTVVSIGTGLTYLADTIWIIGRQQSKDKAKKLDGYDFIINIEKSRKIKEKSKFPVSVKFNKDGVGGIDKWSGLLDIAVDIGYVTKPTAQKYVRMCLKDNPEVSNEDAEKEFSKKTATGVEFWGPIFAYTDFKLDAGNHFRLVPKEKDGE